MLPTDRLLADEEPLADLAVRPAPGDLDEHLALAAAEAERVALRCRIGTALT